MANRALIRIHATAEVSETARLGQGTAVWNQSQIREGVRIGENCILGKDVYIDHDVSIGDNVKIQNGAQIYYGVTIQSGVFIGPGVLFTNDKRPRAVTPAGAIKSDADWEVATTLVREGASLGAGSVILPGLTIGSFALVGAGAVVTKDVQDHAIVVGNPARQAGYACRCATKLEVLESLELRCPSCHETYSFSRPSP